MKRSAWNPQPKSNLPGGSVPHRERELFPLPLSPKQHRGRRERTLPVPSLPEWTMGPPLQGLHCSPERPARKEKLHRGPGRKPDPSTGPRRRGSHHCPQLPLQNAGRSKCQGRSWVTQGLCQAREGAFPLAKGVGDVEGCAQAEHMMRTKAAQHALVFIIPSPSLSLCQQPQRPRGKQPPLEGQRSITTVIYYVP